VYVELHCCDCWGLGQVGLIISFILCMWRALLCTRMSVRNCFRFHSNINYLI
jgi:hypothetical protein